MNMICVTQHDTEVISVFISRKLNFIRKTNSMKFTNIVRFQHISLIVLSISFYIEKTTTYSEF